MSIFLFEDTVNQMLFFKKKNFSALLVVCGTLTNVQDE